MVSLSITSIGRFCQECSQRCPTVSLKLKSVDNMSRLSFVRQMGENSKFIGEEGENLIRNFLERLGWQPLASGLDLSCEFPDQHKSKAAISPRQTHGIDFAFSYVCPLVPDRRRNILVSVKNSSEDETDTRRSLVKNDLKDLATALKCFKRSPERRAMNAEGGGATTSEDLGLLIRINKDKNVDRSYIGDVLPDRLEVESGDAIYYLENLRFDYLDHVMQHIKLFSKAQTHSFCLTKTSLNIAANTRKMASTFLPVQNLIGGPVAVRLDSTEGSKEAPSLIIYSEQIFHIDRFKRLASLGFDLSSNWVNVYVAFPDYLDTKHANLVEQALVGMAQRDFAKRVICMSSDLRARFQ